MSTSPRVLRTTAPIGWATGFSGRQGRISGAVRAAPADTFPVWRVRTLGLTDGVHDPADTVTNSANAQVDEKAAHLGRPAESGADLESSGRVRRAACEP